MNEYKPLPPRRPPGRQRRRRPMPARRPKRTCAAARQGLTIAHFKVQLEDLRNTSLTLELILSTFGTHPRVNLGYMGDKFIIR